VAGRAAPLFTTLAGRYVFRLSGGTPRLINQLCDHALVYGFAKQAQTITADIVLDAAAVRNRHAMFPFKTSPQSLEILASEREEEHAEVQALHARDVQPNGVSHTPDETPVLVHTAVPDPAALYGEAMVLKEAGKFEQAITLFDRLVGEESWGIKALVKRGLCLKAMGRFEEAIGTLQTAISRRPARGRDRLALEYLLGRTFEDAEKPTEAVAVYQQIRQEGVAYRDVEIRLDRLRESPSNGQPTDPAPSSWWGGLFRGYGRVPRDKRTQRFPTFK
jgi:tetratricopeptide (TPR) repeat protein